MFGAGDMAQQFRVLVALPKYQCGSSTYVKQTFVILVPGDSLLWPRWVRLPTYIHVIKNKI